MGIWALGRAVGENKMEKKWAPIVHVCCGGGKKNEKMKWGNEGARLGIGVGGWLRRRNPEMGIMEVRVRLSNCQP